jgi:hypothetical protein
VISVKSFGKNTFGQKIIRKNSFFCGQRPMGGGSGHEREKRIESGIKIIMEPLRYTLAGLIFEKVKLVNKFNFRHGSTSLVNGIATLSPWETGWHGFFEPDSQPFFMTQSKMSNNSLYV